MAHALINSSVYIQKKGESAVTFTAEIINFKESGVKRKVDYKKVVGGYVVPLLNNPLNYEVEFDFIINSLNMEYLMDNDDWGFDFDTYSNNLYMVGINFDDGDSNTYTKRYYDCYITEFTVNPKDEVLQGTIKFSMPIQGVSTKDSIYSGNSLSNANTYDSLMGY